MRQRNAATSPCALSLVSHSLLLRSADHRQFLTHSGGSRSDANEMHCSRWCCSPIACRSACRARSPLLLACLSSLLLRGARLLGLGGRCFGLRLRRRHNRLGRSSSVRHGASERERNEREEGRGGGGPGGCTHERATGAQALAHASALRNHSQHPRASIVQVTDVLAAAGSEGSDWSEGGKAK